MFSSTRFLARGTTSTGNTAQSAKITQRLPSQSLLLAAGTTCTPTLSSGWWTTSPTAAVSSDPGPMIGQMWPPQDHRLVVIEQICCILACYTGNRTRTYSKIFSILSCTCGSTNLFLSLSLICSIYVYFQLG